MKPFYEQRRPAWIYHQKQLDFPLHLHDAIEMVYVLTGSSTVICDYGRLTLGPGDLFFSFPNQVHGYENTRDFDGFMVIATTSVLTGCKTMLTQMQPVQPVIHPVGQAAEDITRLLEMMHSDRVDAPVSLLQGYSLVMLHRVVALMELAPRAATSDTLQAILGYIGEHYREPLSRKQIAQAVGYSESHISHLFTQVLNISLTDYLTMLRMDEARRLLRETELPVSQIALGLGFASIRSFNRFFAQDMPMTPSAYRAAQKKKSQPV